MCCSVESTWLRHLASRGADNDKTGVLLTYPQKITEPLFFRPWEPQASQHPNSHSLSLGALPPPFQHETAASLVDFCYTRVISRHNTTFLTKMSIPPEIIQVKRLVKKRKAADDDDEGIVDYLRP